MARRTAKTKRREKRIALTLAGVLAVVLLTAALVAIPGFEETLYEWLGITKKPVVPGNGLTGPTAIHFVDVGQGDAVLVEQNGEWALIDAGPPEGRTGLLEYMEACGIEGLRYMFMSHPHADHIGGMQAVLDSYTVELVVLPDLDKAPYPTTATFLNLLEKMVELEVKVDTAYVGVQYPLGDGVFTLLHEGLEAEDYNLISTAMLFEAEGIRFLTTGDAETPNEKAMLESGISLRADVYKAGHHGSSTSSSEDFVSAVRPSLVVVCCGRDNRYGHPHATPLEIFEQLGTIVLRTDTDSSVVVYPDGESGIAYITAEMEVAA